MSSIDWTAFFQDAGISSREAKAYSAIFAKNNIGSDLIQHLDRSHLKDMGIIAVGDVMRIMLSAKKENVDKYMTRKDEIEQSNEVKFEIAQKGQDANVDNLRQQVENGCSTKSEGNIRVEENETCYESMDHLKQNKGSDAASLDELDVRVQEYEKADKKIRQQEESDTASWVEENVRVALKSENEKVYGCSHVACNYSGKTITEVKKHMVWHNFDKFETQSQMIKKIKRGDAGGRTPEKIKRKYQAAMDARIKDILKQTSSQDIAKNNGGFELGGVSLPLKAGVQSFDATKASAYMRVEIDKKAKTFCCTACPFTAKTRKELLFHIKGVHFKMQLFRCDECSYTTDFKGNLKQHRERKGHSGKMDYKCIHCGFAADRIGELQSHMQSEHDAEAFTMTRQFMNSHIQAVNEEKSSNITLQQMSLVKASGFMEESNPDDDLIEEHLSETEEENIPPVTDIDGNNTTGYESMDDDPESKADLPGQDLHEVREEKTDAETEYMRRRGNQMIKFVMRGKQRKGELKGEEKPMHCDFCKYKSVQTTRMYKHVQKVHNKTIKITHDDIKGYTYTYL